MKKTASATQFSPSEIVKRPVGGMWKKLNASALASAVAAPSHPPQTDETSSTATRYTTPRATTGAMWASG